MGMSSFKKILKGIDKTLDVTGSVASGLGNMTDQAIKYATPTMVGLGKTGLDVAKMIKKFGFEEISEEALDNSTNILEHLTGLKANKAMNWTAFLGVTGYAAMSNYDDASRRRSMGTIVGADTQPNMVSSVTNPVVDASLRDYANDEQYRGEVDERLESKFGSATPDLVFALHDLRNRG